MRISLYLSGKDREQKLCEALVSGFKRHGEQVIAKHRKEFWSEDDNEDSLAVYVGVKSRKMWNDCLVRKRQVLLIDKGYFSRSNFFRFSLGGYQPPYLDRIPVDRSRLKRLGIVLQPRQVGGNIVIYAGSSNKYCEFHGLGNVNAYASDICAKLNENLQGTMKVIYRPKPSWWANESIDKTVPIGTMLSSPKQELQTLLKQCHCLVTHGSNAAVEALVMGVPILITSSIDVSSVWPLAEHELGNITKPFWPTDTDRLSLLVRLAWCQFNYREITSGFAWQHLKGWL